MPSILTNKNNPFTLKLILSAILGEKKYTLINYESLFDIKSPVKRLPLLELETGSQIFSSNSACLLLFPPSQETNLLVQQILEWENTILVPTIISLLVGKAGTSEKEKLKSCLKYPQSLLAKSEFLSGSSISVADVAVFTNIYSLTQEFKELPEYVSDKLKIWVTKLASLPSFKKGIEQYSIGTGAYKVLTSSSPLLGSVEASVEAGDSPSHQTSDALTQEELNQAKTYWLNKNVNKPKPAVVPVLPVPGERNVLITSALPYVNNVPHLGNIIGCVLSADVFARYCRLCNYNTLYISGTDEYGTATETKALAEGCTPQQICDKYFQIHNDIYRWFEIGFDYFGRTTTPEQTEICQEMFLKLNSNGFISTETIEQLFCPKCERFLADRFVEGTCPHIGCNYEDARGDQCDGCGKLVNATDLKNPRCKLCSTAPRIEPSEQFFLDLPKIEPVLKLWMEKVYDGWSHNAKVISQAWLKEGLKPRCITRDLKWGIPVPLEKYKNKVFYVWFDAPIGYMSMSKRYAPKSWLEWWKPNPEKATNVELFQFMAKDNVPFHSVMFPATLLAANEGYTTVKHLMATEYLNYEDGKFSKSRGVGVFGNDAQDTGIPADVWRFYLLFVRPESQDSSFSWVDLATKNNSELLNNLGNFINRALVFTEKFFNSTIPEIVLEEDDIILLALCNRELAGYVNALEKARLRDAIRNILAISRHGNQYMQANQPWVLVKGTEQEKIKAGTVIGLCVNIACLLATLLHPYMPQTSRVIKGQLNAPDNTTVLSPKSPTLCQLLPTGHKIGKPSPLFSKIEPNRVEELKAKYGGSQESRNKTGNVSQQNHDAKTLEAEIAKQADKVRTLKSSGVEKAVWQPEVQVLLSLKKQLEEAKKSVTVTTNEQSRDAKTLETEVAKQADKVRTLKSSGVEKAVWQPEVQILLNLKKQLEEAKKNEKGNTEGKDTILKKAVAGLSGTLAALASKAKK